MVKTVLSAFEQFRQDIVDLNPDLTRKARLSRDYLFNQIRSLSRNSSNFPKLASGDPFVNFGSFARKSKIQPLDDIDFLIVLNGNNTVVEKIYSSPYKYNLKFIQPSVYLLSMQSERIIEQFADSEGYINSTKILNKIKSHLSLVSNYEKAKIEKTLQAVTLKLSSYSWNFDIVPGIAIPNNFNDLAYFLIPDGYGKWIATDPRVDSYNTTKVNLTHQGKFLPTLRLLKYWNGKPHKPRLLSYYFETLVIKVFENSQKINNFSEAIKYFFDWCPLYIRQSCPDPKGLEPNLDSNIDQSVKDKIIKAMSEASTYAEHALNAESTGNHKDAIYCWQQIFGLRFPNYG